MILAKINLNRREKVILMINYDLLNIKTESIQSVMRIKLQWEGIHYISVAFK